MNLYDLAKDVTEGELGVGAWSDPRYPAPLWQPERGVWRVKTTLDWHVEILPALFNYRLVLTPVGGDLQTWEHGWCFFGTTALSFARACLAGAAFDPQTQSAPVGYDKALTGRR